MSYIYGKLGMISNFCNQQDSILHTLFFCTHIRDLWNRVEKFVSQFVTSISEIDFSLTNIIFNTVHGKAAHVVNTLVLINKQLICRFKCKKEKITYSKYDAEVTLHEKIKFHLANKNNKVSFHNIKWEKLRKTEQGNVNLKHHVEFFVNNDKAQ